MPAAWAAGISAAVGAVSAAASADASRKAAHTQADAAATASAQQRADTAPWREAGAQALTDIQTGLAPGGEFSKTFTMADAKNSPAMQEAQRAGTEVIQNSAAAKGGLIGTNAMTDLTKFGQANAAQYENQAFNQYMAEKGQKLGAEQSLAQIGQTTTSQVADNVSNLTLAGANANAAGGVASSNAINKGASDVTGQISMLAGLFGNGGGSTSSNATSGAGMPMAYNMDTGATYSPASTYGP